jgi:hypothetical protein
MFGWLKRKSPDDGRLVQLASGSAQRRARQNRTSEDDQAVLLTHTLDLAVFFLEGGQLPTFLPVRDGFPPFGAGINPAGDLVDFNCLPAPGNPRALNVFCLPDQLACFAQLKETRSRPDRYNEPPPLEALVQGMRQHAIGGGLHVAALVDWAAALPSEPAIRIQMEHAEAAPVTWHLPFRMSDQKLIRGELSKVAGQSAIFAALGPARQEPTPPALDTASLLAMLHSEAKRDEALTALATKRVAALSAIPHLIELLRDEDQQVVTKVLKTLKAIGPPAQEAALAVRELANDEDQLIRLHARAALEAIASGNAAPQE